MAKAKKEGFFSKLIAKLSFKKKKVESVWFGPKGKKSVTKTEEEITEALKPLADSAKAYMDKVNAKLSGGNAEAVDVMVKKTATYLYDFFGGRYQNGVGQNRRIDFDEEADDDGFNDAMGGMETAMFEGNLMQRSQSKTGKDVRTKVTPKEVHTELELPVSPMALENLEEKIALVQDKLNVVYGNKYSREQLNGMIVRLNNRKKYNEVAEFFGSFKTTNDEKIDALLKKYYLEINTSDLFVPDFPKEAIDVMEDYTKEVVKLCGKKPVYYVIAEAGEFQKKYEKRDPILLAQSPFGFYYSVLGAWSDEMLILHEL